jgi:predicted metal-dependent hydrolase
MSEPAGPPVRDRDPAGRARNARPRDALGRPLERGTPGEPVTPDDLDLKPAEALKLAQQLIDRGRPFHAHEVLEASWRAAPPPERELWRGLAQLAVGLTHARRGNARGAVALLRRGALAVGGYAGSDPHGVDAGGVAAAAISLADQISAAGPGELPRPRLQLAPPRT